MKRVLFFIFALLFMFSCSDSIKHSVVRNDQDVDESGDVSADQDDVIADVDDVTGDEDGVGVDDDSVHSGDEDGVGVDDDSVYPGDTDVVLDDDFTVNPDDDTEETDSDVSSSDSEVDADVALLGNGESCLSGDVCKSGHCVDGYCCDSKCEGLCEACNVSGSVGTCTPVPNGEDPDNECDPDDPAGCQHNGFCDGKGKCALYDDKTVCSASCVDDGESGLLGVLYCDGKGTCQTEINSVGCEGYICKKSDDECGTSCKDGGRDNHDLCDNKHYCQDGACTGVRKKKGAKCNNHDYECLSDSCEWEGPPMMGDYKCQ